MGPLLPYCRRRASYPQQSSCGTLVYLVGHSCIRKAQTGGMSSRGSLLRKRRQSRPPPRFPHLLHLLLSRLLPVIQSRTSWWMSPLATRTILAELVYRAVDDSLRDAESNEDVSNCAGRRLGLATTIMSNFKDVHVAPMATPGNVLRRMLIFIRTGS